MPGHRPGRLARALGLPAVFGVEELASREIARVVLVGPQRRSETFQAGFAVAAPLVAAGARLALHNLGLVEDPAMLAPSPEALALLSRAERVSARDHQSQAFMLDWGLPAVPRLAAYAEAGIAADPSLAARLSPRPLLGLSLGGRNDQAGLRDGALGRLPGLAERPAGFGLPPMPLVLPMACDREAWLEDMTPYRFAGLMSVCDMVVTETDFAAAVAASAWLPCIGLAGLQRNGLHRAIATLADRLGPGSACLMPPWPC